ncbi:PEGA domain-containing protein [Thermococcus sp.]
MRWAGLILAVLLLIPLVEAQPWWNAVVGTGNLAVTKDGARAGNLYYFTGATNDSVMRPFLVAVNESGEVQWGKLFGFEGIGMKVLSLPSGNVLLVGSVGYPQSLSNGTFLVTLTQGGDEIWGKLIPGMACLGAVYNGGIYIVGRVNGSTVLVKLDKDGNVIWAKKYPYSRIGGPVYPLENGVVFSPSNTLIMAVDGHGSELWALKVHGDEVSVNSLAVDSDGYIYASGVIRGEFSTDYYGEIDGWVMKLSPDGYKVFGIKLEAAGVDVVQSVFPMDNLTAAVGFSAVVTTSDPNKVWDWVVLIDSSGKLVSVSTFNIFGRFYWLEGGNPDGNDVIAFGRVWINEERAFRALLARVPSRNFPCACPKLNITTFPDGVSVERANITGKFIELNSIEFTPRVYPWNPREEVLYYYRLPVIIVHSNPTNATVIIDGKIIGKTPVSTSLSPGNHTIVVMKDGYLPYNHTFSASLNELQNLTVNLVPERTNLEISTVPPGALIKVDGKPVGRSPLSIEVEPGRHVVSAEMRNYLSNSTEVNVHSGESVEVFLKLNPLPCRLRVLSRPNATVHVAGKTLETPADIELPPGNYTLKLSRANYTTYSRNLTCTPNGTVEISVNLTPVFGILRIITNEKAGVYVDGKFVGVGNVTVNLKVGRHRVVIEGSELKNYTVSIEPGKETVLKVNTEKFEKGTTETTSPLTTSSTTHPEEEKSKTICGPGVVLVVSLLILLRRV